MISLSVNDLKDATVIIPTVSVGNIPQLAVDLIINNTPCVNVGSVWHEAILPYVSSDPFDENSTNISTAVEAYYYQAMKLLIFQFRSPLVGREKTRKFVEELCNWLKAKQVGKVVIVSGMYSAMMVDEEIQDQSKYSDFRYVASPEFLKSYEKEISDLKWAPFLQEARVENYVPNYHLQVKNMGVGFGRELYNLCVSNGISSIIILKFGSDGYNIPDAQRLVQFLNEWLHFVRDSEKALKHPVSWEVLDDRAPDTILDSSFS